MQIKNPGLWILLFGPAIILTIAFVPTLNYQGIKLWIPILLSLGGLVPLLGGFLIGGHGDNTIKGTLLYLPASIITFIVYAIFRASFDPISAGAFDMSLVLCVKFLIPASLIGTVVALLGTKLGNRN